MIDYTVYLLYLLTFDVRILDISVIASEYWSAQGFYARRCQGIDLSFSLKLLAVVYHREFLRYRSSKPLFFHKFS